MTLIAIVILMAFLSLWSFTYKLDRPAGSFFFAFVHYEASVCTELGSERTCLPLRHRTAIQMMSRGR